MNTIPPIKFNTYNQRRNTDFKGIKTSIMSVEQISSARTNAENITRRFANKAHECITPLLAKIYSPCTNLINMIIGQIVFTRHGINSWYGNETVRNMRKEILNLNRKHHFGISLCNIESYDSGKKNIFLQLRNPIVKDRFFLIFDKRTGKLLSFNKNIDTKIQIKEQKMTHSSIIDNNGNKMFVNENDDEEDKLCQIVTSTVTDLDGHLFKKTEMELSPFYAEYEINEYEPNGKKYKIGLAETDELQGTHIERNFVSPDGTRTDYVYADDKINRFLYYKITDKNGEILYENSEIFKKLEPSHYISTSKFLSGMIPVEDKFDIKFTDDKVIVTKLDKQNNITENRVIYNIKEYTDEDYSKYEKIHQACTNPISGTSNLLKEYEKHNAADKHTVDKNLLPLLEQLSGEEWFNMDSAKVEFIRKCNFCTDNAHALHGGIEIGKNCEELSVLEHELGHEILQYLLNNRTLLMIFNEEKSLCTKFLPKSELKLFSYLINNKNGNERSLSETIAEINCILKMPNQFNKSGPRAIYIMKYFPKTIAHIANDKKYLLWNSNLSLDDL